MNVRKDLVSQAADKSKEKLVRVEIIEACVLAVDAASAGTHLARGEVLDLRASDALDLVMAGRALKV
jgi:hypothetical protein